MSELKPCPFCGAVAEFNPQWQYGVSCTNDSCAARWANISADNWNTRVSPDLTAKIEAAAEEIEMAIEGYNIEQRQWARARSEAGGNIISDGFIGEALLNELNEWDIKNPMPRPRTDIAAIIKRHLEGGK